MHSFLNQMSFCIFLPIRHCPTRGEELWIYECALDGGSLHFASHAHPPVSSQVDSRVHVGIWALICCQQSALRFTQSVCTKTYWNHPRLILFFWLHPTSSTTFRSLSKSSSWVMHKQTQGESFLPPDARNLLVATCFVRYLKKREKENDQRVSPGSWNWHTVHNLTDIKFRFVSLCHTLCLEKDQVKQPTCMSECCYSPSVWDAGEVSELPKHFPYKFDSNCVAWSLQKINMKTLWIGSLLDLSFQTMLQV